MTPEQTPQPNDYKPTSIKYVVADVTTPAKGAVIIGAITAPNIVLAMRELRSRAKDEKKALKLMMEAKDELAAQYDYELCGEPCPSRPGMCHRPLGHTMDDEFGHAMPIRIPSGEFHWR